LGVRFVWTFSRVQASSDLYVVDRFLTSFYVFLFYFAAHILGDALYGSAATSPLVSARTSIPEDRLFLHSSSISFWVRVFGFYSPFFFAEGAERTVLPSEVSPRRASQTVSFDNFRPSSSGLHQNVPRFKLGFT
jgi:hypothetical protein